MNKSLKIFILLAFVLVAGGASAGYFYWQNKKSSQVIQTAEQQKVTGSHERMQEDGGNKQAQMEEIDMITDTDGDGLTDYDEVNKYKTEKSNPDTDGDGYSDGIEVASGYNPLGQGRLSLSQPDIRTVTIDFKNGASFMDLTSGRVVSDVDLFGYLDDEGSLPPSLLDGVDLWIESDPEITCISEEVNDELKEIGNQNIKLSTLQWFTTAYKPYKLYVDEKGVLTDCHISFIKEGIVFIVQDYNKDYYQVRVKEIGKAASKRDASILEFDHIVLEYVKLESNEIETIAVSKQPDPRAAYVLMMGELNKVSTIDDFKKFISEYVYDISTPRLIDVLTNGLGDYSPQEIFRDAQKEGLFSQDVTNVTQYDEDRVGNVLRFGNEDNSFYVLLDNDRWVLIFD